MSRIESKVLKVKDPFGRCQILHLEKVMPDNEDQYLHIFEVVTRRDGCTAAVNHLRLHGAEFNRIPWARHGWNRGAVTAVINRYFDTVAKVQAELHAKA